MLHVRSATPLEGRRLRLTLTDRSVVERDIAAARLWRSYVDRYPWAAVIAAAGAGVLVGNLLAGRLSARGPRLPYPPAPEL